MPYEGGKGHRKENLLIRVCNLVIVLGEKPRGEKNSFQVGIFLDGMILDREKQSSKGERVEVRDAVQYLPREKRSAGEK